MKHPRPVNRVTENMVIGREPKLTWADGTAKSAWAVCTAALNANSEAYMAVVKGYRAWLLERAGTTEATHETIREFFGRK